MRLRRLAKRLAIAALVLAVLAVGAFTWFAFWPLEGKVRRLEDLVPADVDFVYTTRWQTTGTSKPDASWRETFRPFHIDETFLSGTPGALFLHDLPAHRGEEVSGAVLDGPRSVAWSQARMKLCSAMAVLEYAFAGRD